MTSIVILVSLFLLDRQDAGIALSEVDLLLVDDFNAPLEDFQEYMA